MIDIISEYFHEDKEKFSPAAAILGYPLTDYIYKEDSEAKRDPSDQMFFRAFHGTEVPEEDMLDEVSPARHVTKNTPSIFYGRPRRTNLCRYSIP